MKSLNMILLINIFIFGIFGSYVVNRNDWNKHHLHRRKHTRKERKTGSHRKLQGETGIISGNTVGSLMGIAGAGLAFAGNDDEKKQLKDTLSLVKTQFFRAQVLSQRNKDLYRDMDEILINLEDKIEDLGDDVYQKMSDFDSSIKSKLTGKTFMPSYSSLD